MEEYIDFGKINIEKGEASMMDIFNCLLRNPDIDPKTYLNEINLPKYYQYKEDVEQAIALKFTPSQVPKAKKYISNRIKGSIYIIIGFIPKLFSLLLAILSTILHPGQILKFMSGYLISLFPILLFIGLIIVNVNIKTKKWYFSLSGLDRDVVTLTVFLTILLLPIMYHLAKKTYLESDNGTIELERGDIYYLFSYLFNCGMLYFGFLFFREPTDEQCEKAARHEGKLAYLFYKLKFNYDRRFINSNIICPDDYMDLVGDYTPIYDKDGIDQYGYNKEGFNILGVDKHGFDYNGLNEEGRDVIGYSPSKDNYSDPVVQARYEKYKSDLKDYKERKEKEQ